MAIDHTNTSTIYLGTEIGIYKKAMDATTWSFYNTDFPNVSINELEIMHGSNTIRAATWGRGLWEYSLDGRADFPAITNTSITNKPTEEVPGEGQAQIVTATIEYDNTITSTFLKWSTDTPTFDNTIAMSNSTGKTWVSDSPLPDAPEGTKMFFKVFAVGANNDTTETYKFMYIVRPTPNTTFIDAESNWAYFDNESEPPVQGAINWQANNYDDSAWSTGDAQLGYGDNDETTAINSATRTAYFRKEFNIVEPSLYGDLYLQLLYDDGGIVYLNGTEIWRVNMPAGAVSYNTFTPQQSSDDEIARDSIANTLQAGTNVIAIEIHQRSSNSSDLSFDFSIVGSPGDGCIIGASCDDEDVCTENDVYDADCNCVGTAVGDSDNDGVCDAEDQCPGKDDLMIGSTCDDGDDCTENDVFNSNCDCIGTEIGDSDNDGVCDAIDQCPDKDDTLIGTMCDDGNACTENDVYDADCNCVGTLLLDSDGDGVCDDLDECDHIPGSAGLNGCAACAGDTWVSPSGTITAGNYYYAQTIESDGQIEINTAVRYLASQSITLKEGFHAKKGATFHAFIDVCTIENPITTPANARVLKVEEPNQPLNQPHFTIYPNPTTNQVTVEVKHSDGNNLAINLYDGQGRILKSLKQNSLETETVFSYQLDVSSYPKGIYLLQVQNNQFSQTQKLIIL